VRCACRNRKKRPAVRVASKGEGGGSAVLKGPDGVPYLTLARLAGTVCAIFAPFLLRRALSATVMGSRPQAASTFTGWRAFYLPPTPVVLLPPGYSYEKTEPWGSIHDLKNMSRLKNSTHFAPTQTTGAPSWTELELSSPSTRIGSDGRRSCRPTMKGRGIMPRTQRYARRRTRILRYILCTNKLT
jgi:hypothetical protein